MHVISNSLSAYFGIDVQKHLPLRITFSKLHAMKTVSTCSSHSSFQNSGKIEIYVIIKKMLQVIHFTTDNNTVHSYTISLDIFFLIRCLLSTNVPTLICF